LPADLHIGGLSIDEYFERIITKGSMGVDIIAYGRKIYDLALRRSLIQLCEDLLRSAYADSPDLPLRNLIVEAERRLGILSTDRQQGGLRSFSQTLISAVDTMARTFVRNEGVSGVATGFHDLDRITGGLQPSDLIILAGRPGMGKSAFGMNVAYNAARNWRGEVREDGTIETKAGGIVGFFSLEMSAEQLATRIISAHSEVPSDRIRSGAIATSDFDLVASVAREMEAMPLYIDDTGGLSVAQLAARARRLKRQRSLDLIIVDNVQLLIREPASTAKSHLKQTSEITATLKALAKELSVPILALSQLPQKVDTREDKRPQLSDIFESEVMEQYVDVVLFVYREENYTKFLEPRPGTDEYFRWVTEMEMLHGKAEIIIAKQRYGPTGIVSFQFQADISRFSDIQYR
jgi:replicative DNA helicase